MIKEKELPKAVVNNKLITHKATGLTIMSYDKNVHKLIIPTDLTQDQINDIIVLITFRYHDNIIQISGELVEDKIEIILPNEIRSLSGEFYIEIDINLTDNRQITFARYRANVVKSDIDSVDLDDAKEFYFELFDDFVQKVADKSEVAVSEIDTHKQSVSDKADTAITVITDASNSVTTAKQSALTSITQATSDFTTDLADTQSTIDAQVTQAQDSLQEVTDTLTAVNDKVTTVNDATDSFMADVATKQADVTSKYNAFDTSVTQAGQTIDEILALQPQFQAVLDETTDKDVISAPEIIVARGGAQTLGERLDSEKAEVTAQLAQTANKEALLKQALDSMSMLSKKELIVSDYFSSGATTFATTETRQKWETLSGAFKITDGKVFSEAVSTWSKAIIETYANNVEISFAVRSFSGHPRIIFRVKDTNDYWFFGVASEIYPNGLALGKVVNGVLTIAQSTSWDLSTSAGSRMRVVINGNKIKCYINNYLTFDKIVDTDFIAETKHGISLYGTGGEINAFKIEAIEKINYPDNLIASVDNKLVSYDGTHLLLSEDGGRSYKKGISIQDISIIKYVHLFGDGKLLFADHQNVYYTHDWQTYHKSTVYDADGLIYVPDEYDNFSCYKNGTVKKIVDGKELAVWGNYSTVAGIEFSDKIKVWSTSDYGKTIKVAYTCNTPTTVKCRHIHAVDFNPADSSFWLQTGDEPVGSDEMSHWVKGEYISSTDTWIWTPFASGEKFKTTNMIFHTDGYVYFSWDLTPGGAVKAPIATMHDSSTHELLFRTNKDCHFLIVGPSGDIAVFQTAWGGTEQPRVFYYAPDGVTFNRIYGSMPLAFDQIADAQYQTYWPINSDGKVLAGIQSLSQQNIRDWDRKPSIFIDDIIRENGYPNAFK